MLDGRLSGRTLPALSARGAIAAGVSFQGSQLQGAMFDSADLRGAGFRAARLAYADLDTANLAPLSLAGGGGKPVDFGEAELTNVRRFQRRPVMAAA